MKALLTISLIISLPFFSIGQSVSDTGYMPNRAQGDFHEFYWQKEIRVLKDTSAYAPFSLIPLDDCSKLEILDSKRKLIWTAEDPSKTSLISSSILQDSTFTIRAYNGQGVTEVIWKPDLKQPLVLNRE